MAKKTEVRVKRTDAWAALEPGKPSKIQQLSGFFWSHTCESPSSPTPVTIIDRRDLADLEARLKAAEAECKELRRQLKAAGVIIKTLRENRV